MDEVPGMGQAVSRREPRAEPERKDVFTEEDVRQAFRAGWTARGDTRADGIAPSAIEDHVVAMRRDGCSYINFPKP